MLQRFVVRQFTRRSEALHTKLQVSRALHSVTLACFYNSKLLSSIRAFDRSFPDHTDLC